MTTRGFEEATGCKLIDCSQTDSESWLRAYAEGTLIAEVRLRCKLSRAIYLLAEQVFHVNTSTIIREQKHRCAGCGGLKPLQGHHKVHRSRGPNHRTSNIEALCQMCHAKKHGG